MRSDHNLRWRLAVEAARICSDEGIRDFGMAKRKAAQRLGVADERALPSNVEIDQALREHQRLFRRSSQPPALLRLRETASEAMRFLRRFQPRLVGAVLDGSADQHSAVSLHLFSDTPEEASLFLLEQGIPFEESQRTLRLDRERSAEFPVLCLAADGIEVELTVLPPALLRQAPLSPIDEKPVRRASLAQLQEMLAAEAL